MPHKEMKVNQNIQEILSLINPVLSKELNSSIEFPVEFTFYHVLERVQMNLDSILVLTKDSIIKHNHAIGLLSRNLLSDFITTGFIIRLSKSEDEHYSNLYSLYDSDLKKADAFIKMYKDAGYIEENSYSEYNNRYSNENHIYKLIRDYRIEFGTKDFPATKSIIECFLKSDLTDAWALQIKKSYDIWTLLSKYEHIGWNSYDATREITETDILKRLNIVLLNTTIMIASCFEILKEENARITAMDMIKNNY
jgi:hypothetical protein